MATQLLCVAPLLLGRKGSRIIQNCIIPAEDTLQYLHGGPRGCAANSASKGNKRRGAQRDGEGQCAAFFSASEGYVSDVEVRLHDMHVHDQVFITKNDEHFGEISMKQ